MIQRGLIALNTEIFAKNIPLSSNSMFLKIPKIKINSPTSSAYLYEEEETEITNTQDIGVNTEKDYLNRKQTQFSSQFGIFSTFVGCVVGTGNIWRFPRICAVHSASQGSLVFLILWFLFLNLWSIPITIVEYTVGRFSQCSPILTFCKFLGPIYLWTGSWIIFIATCLSFYYSVVVGWTIYYFVKMSICAELPDNEFASQAIFDNFTNDTYWPVLTQMAAIFIVGLCLIGGLKWIERMNMVLVPLFLIILLFNFTWSLTTNYANVGIRFLFTPAWHTFMDPNVWIAAVSQNAFDTSAGMGAFASYSSHFTATDTAVLYAVWTPFFNNIVSLISGIMIYCTVFSTMISLNPTMTQDGILLLMKKSGPVGTGLTFSWMPIIFSQMGKFGRILCSSFFLCQIFAGLTSLISLLNMVSITLIDFGSLPSALSIDFLNLQDFTWSHGLIISGFFFSFLVIIYGPEKFRSVVVNDFGIGDWTLPKIWSPIIGILIPLEAISIITWWIYNKITEKEFWYIPTFDSLITILIEWISLGILLILFTILLIRQRSTIIQKCLVIGNDPYLDKYFPQNSEQKLETNIKNKEHPNLALNDLTLHNCNQELVKFSKF